LPLSISPPRAATPAHVILNENELKTNIDQEENMLIQKEHVEELLKQKEEENGY